MSRRDWKVYGVCPECGNTALLTFGDMWFLKQDMPVCTVCGTSVSKWERRTGRRVISKKGKHFWSRDTWGWEWKE